MKSLSVARLFAEPSESSRLRTWIAIGVLGDLIAGAIFLAYRQQDIGRFGSLVDSFLHSISRQSVIGTGPLIQHLLGIGIAAAVSVSWFGLGEVLLKCFRPPADPPQGSPAIVWSCAAGAGFWSLIWFVAGLAGMYNQSMAIGLLAAGLTLAVTQIKWRRPTIRLVNLGGPLDITAVLVIAIPALLAMVAALAPVTGKDAMVYRLAIPRLYEAAGSIVDGGTNVFSHLSFGAEMNGLWGLLIGGGFSAEAAETAFAMISYSSFPLLLLAVWGIAREYCGTNSWALCATSLVAAVPTMYYVAASSYVDHTLALFILLSVHALGKWWHSPVRSNAILLGIALGAALSVKMLALFAFVPVFFVVLFRLRQAQATGQAAIRPILTTSLLALLMAGALACPWYLHTWAKTGSPVFPFYSHVWPGNAPGWDAERSALSQLLMSQYGGAHKGFLDYLSTPFRLSIQAQPEIPADFDGVLGISFLVLLPLLGWAAIKVRLPAHTGMTLGVAAGWFTFWLFTSQQLRFLLPAIPLLAVAIVSAASQVAGRSEGKLLKWTIVGSTFVGLLTIVSWFIELNPVRAALGGESADEFLTRREDYFPYYQAVNRDLPATSRVWLVNIRNDTIHLSRQVLADYVFEDYTLTGLVRQGFNLADLRQRVRALGVTHLLIRHDVLLDYRRTPVVDEKRSEDENLKRLALLHDFLRQGTRILKEDSKFMLIDLQFDASGN